MCGVWGLLLLREIGCIEIRRHREASDKGCLLVLDDRHRPRSWISADHLQRTEHRPFSEIGLPLAMVEPRATLSDTLNEMLTARYSTAVVVDESGAYSGIVDIDTINEAIRGMQTAERERLRGQAMSGEDAVEPVR